MAFNFSTTSIWWVIGIGLAIMLALMVLRHTSDNKVLGAANDLERWQRESRNWATNAAMRRNLMPEKRFLEKGCGNKLFLGWHGDQAVLSGKYSSLLVVASTGSGKTTRLIVQNLLAHKAGPAVATSVKADVWELTRVARERGGRALGFDPCGSYGIASCRFSPLMDIRKFSDAQAVATILLNGSKALSDSDLQNQGFWDSHGRQALAPLLLVAVQLGRSMCDVNGLLATPDLVERTLQAIGDRSAIRAWQLHTQQWGETRQNVESTVGQVLEVWSRDVLRPIVNVGRHAHLGVGREDSRSIWDDATSFITTIQAPLGGSETSEAGTPTPLGFDKQKQLDDNSWVNRQTGEISPTETIPLVIPPAAVSTVDEEGVIPLVTPPSTAPSADEQDVVPLVTPPAAAQTDDDADRLVGDILDLDAFLTSNDTLYLLSTQADQEAFSPVFDVLIQMILARLERWSAKHNGLPLNPGLLMLIDEAANIARLRNLDVIVTKARGEGCKLVTVWQSMAQIMAIYGPYRGRVVWDNHLNKMFMGGLDDDDTMQFIVKMVGKNTRPQISSTTNADGTISHNVSYYERDVVDTFFFNSVLTDDEGVLSLRVGSKLKPAIVTIPEWFEDNRIRTQIPAEIAQRYDEAFRDDDDEPTRKGRRAIHA